jgi:RNA polymerase sigma factor (sigma-70 family)
MREDACIVYKCLNGEPEAFGILVDKYKAGIYAYVYAKLGNFHDAQDVTQEVFLEAYRSLRNLKRWESFSFWLYRIANNICGNTIRSQSRRPDREFVEDQDTRMLDFFSISSYRESQLNESLQEALASLSQGYREVLMLHYFGGMNSVDIARSLGTSPTAVRKRLSRARAQLREEMLAVMDTAYEGQKLQATFTFRVVEVVKRIKIPPMPRATTLPWGLSLAAGIIMAILSFNPHLNLINPQGFPSGSPLPVEMKVLKTGEIPVQMLRISQTLAIASKQGDGDGGELRPNDERGAFLLAPQASEVKLRPENVAEGDSFGYSVAIHGDYAIVGAPGKDDKKGVAYIFKRDGDSWKEQQMLFADDRRKEDYFGSRIAISDEFAFVSAPLDDDRGEGTGSVYIFRRTGESWAQQDKLYPHGQWITWCYFGRDMDISGDYLVVGSPFEENSGGAIYIFKRDGNTWNEQAKLKSSDWAVNGYFGEAASISGDYVIAAAPYHKNNKGSAYIFKREGDKWEEQAILTADDGDAEVLFGQLASISGNYVIVGAGGPEGIWTGAAYIFVRDGTSWKQQAKLLPDDSAGDDRFVSTICISGDYAIVGASGADCKGATIYGFMRDGNSWNQVSERVVSDAMDSDWFGRAVALSGNYAIVGTHGIDADGKDSCAAYIYNCSEFFPVESSDFSPTTFGGEKDKPVLRDTLLPPPDKHSIPKEFRLLQNFPNPFNPETWLPYELASDADVMVWIYNSSGELVRKLNPGRQEAGFYTTRDKAAYWDGRNESGEQVSSGVYFYTIQAGEFRATKKMSIAD